MEFPTQKDVEQLGREVDAIVASLPKQPSEPHDDATVKAMLAAGYMILSSVVSIAESLRTIAKDAQINIDMVARERDAGEPDKFTTL